MCRLSQSWRENKLTLTLSAQIRVVSWLGIWLLTLAWLLSSRRLCFGSFWQSRGVVQRVSDMLAGYFTCWLCFLPLLLSSGHSFSWPMSIPAKLLEVATSSHLYCHWWILIKGGRRGLSLSQATLGSPGDYSSTSLLTHRIFSALFFLLLNSFTQLLETNKKPRISHLKGTSNSLPSFKVGSTNTTKIKCTPPKKKKKQEANQSINKYFECLLYARCWEHSGEHTRHDLP